MTRIPDRGLAPADVFERLRGFRAADAAWADGRTFGHAFLDTEARRGVSEEACTLFLWENGLDPTMFPSLAALEREVVDMVAHHLGAPDTAQGTFPSGAPISALISFLWRM